MVTYLLNTLLSLNLIASGIYLLLQGLLALAKNHVNEKFRYQSCISVLLLFFIPFYQVLPISPASNPPFPLAEPRAPFQNMVIPPTGAEPFFFSPATFHLSQPMQTGILLVWAVGAAAMTVWYLSVFYSFRRRLSQKNSVPISKELQSLADRCAKECQISHRPILRAFHHIHTPMLIGFFKPIIAVPADKLSLADAPLIFKHELVHFKRHDLWWKVLSVLLQAIYWFNPLVWRLCKELEFYTETSCDAEVVQEMDFEERKRYGHLLISYVQLHHTVPSAPGVAFTPTHNKLKRRISIMLNGNKSKKLIACAIVCITAASGFALSAFAAETNRSTPRAIDGFVTTKEFSAPNPDELTGQEQPEIPFAPSVDPNNGWNAENKNPDNGYCRRGGSYESGRGCRRQGQNGSRGCGSDFGGTNQGFSSQQ